MGGKFAKLGIAEYSPQISYNNLRTLRSKPPPSNTGGSTYRGGLAVT